MISDDRKQMKSVYQSCNSDVSSLMVWSGRVPGYAAWRGESPPGSVVLTDFLSEGGRRRKVGSSSRDEVNLWTL